MQDLISLIIPYYNAAEFIEEAILSFINQDYKNIEIIFVDDGSKDDSINIVKKYQEKDNRIKFVKQPNQGPAIARNTGIEHAKGKYIVFADADDLLTPDYISYLHSLLKDTNCKAAFCRRKMFVDNPCIEEKEEKIEAFTSCTKILQYFLKIKDVDITVNAAIFERTLFDEVKFKKYYIYEDIEFLVRLFTCTSMMITSNQEKYHYRQQENSITHSSFAQKNIDSFKLLNEMEKVIKEKAPRALPEFYYYKLCVTGDQYKYLAYSDYEDKKKMKEIILSEYNKTLKENYRKDLVNTRQKVLWGLMSMPMPIYKLVVNLVRIVKGGS